MKMPAFSDGYDAGAISVEERHISHELMAYLNWLIYSAAFKESLAVALGATHIQFYLKWTVTFASKEDVYSKKLSMRRRFGMTVSRQVKSVAVVCWQQVLEFQSEVHCSTIPSTTNRLVEQVLLEPVLVVPLLAPLPGALGAVLLNK